MKSKNRRKPYLLVTVNLIISTCVILGIRFTHLHLTETELFFKFWYVWLWIAFCLGLTFQKLNVK